MKKRGQVTVFIIIGIVLVAIISLVIYLKTSISRTDSETKIKEIVSFADAKLAVKEHVENCLKSALTESVPNLAGRQFNSIEQYELTAAMFIEDRTKACINLNMFKNFKVTADLNKIKVEVFTSKDKGIITAKAYLDVNIKSDDKTEKLHDFTSILQLKQTAYKEK